MKKTLFAGLALMTALASCQKTEIVEREDVAQNESTALGRKCATMEVLEGKLKEGSYPIATHE